MECGDNSVLSFGDKNLIIVAIAPPKQKLPKVKLLPLAGSSAIHLPLRGTFSLNEKECVQQSSQN